MNTFIHKPHMRPLVLFSVLGIILLVALVAPEAYAESLENPVESERLDELIENVARAIAAIGIPFVAVFLVIAGFMYVTAGGNEERVKAAKKMFTWGLVGGAIVIGAWALATAVVNFARSLSP